MFRNKSTENNLSWGTMSIKLKPMILQFHKFTLHPGHVAYNEPNVPDAIGPLQESKPGMQNASPEAPYKNLSLPNKFKNKVD